jgi:hypothetical protein
MVNHLKRTGGRSFGFDIGTWKRSELQPLRKRIRRFAQLLVPCLALAVLLFTPPLAQAQGCALCYTQAASSGSRMIQALRSGILLLIVPPTLMSIGVVFVAYAKRNQFRRIDALNFGSELDVDVLPDDENSSMAVTASSARNDAGACQSPFS